MIETNINENQIERAQKLYDFNNLNNSITKGAGQKYGALGEIITGDYFKGLGLVVGDTSTRDWDLTINGYKIEVKTKAVNHPPKPYHKVSVAESNHSQLCDYYFFAFVFNNLTKGFILGYKSPEDYYNLATHHLKGETDHPTDFIFKANCYNLRVSELDEFKLKTLSL